MPIYDVLCPECEKEWEDYAPIAGKDTIPCPYCHEKGETSYGVTQITIKSKPKVYGNQMDEVDPGLGVKVGSEEERQTIMRQNHLEEVGGERCSTTHRNTVEQDKKRDGIEGELGHFGFKDVSVESVAHRGF